MPTPRPECTCPADALPYPRTKEDQDLAEFEDEIAVYWEQDDTFAATQDPARADSDVFGDGKILTFNAHPIPPASAEPRATTNLVAGYQLDTLARFHTMRGALARRPFELLGHGMRIEREVQRKLKLKDRKAIEKYGVEAFAAACEVRALELAEDWPPFLARQGRWADTANTTQAWELPYQESVLWAFKTLHGKGLVEFGTDSEYVCARCETLVQETFDTILLPPSSEHPEGRSSCGHCCGPITLKKVPRWVLQPEALGEKLKAEVSRIQVRPGHPFPELLRSLATHPMPLILSRPRYFATIIPVWTCDRPKCGQSLVVGSLEEIRSAFGVEVEDLHPGQVDGLTRPCSCKKGKLRRVPSTLAPWFEAACSFFARHHVPFENAEAFRDAFPASFMGATPDQVVSAVYASLVVGVALFDQAPSLSLGFATILPPERFVVSEHEEEDGRRVLEVEERPSWMDPELGHPDDPASGDPRDPRKFFRPLPSDALRGCLLQGIPVEDWDLGLQRVRRAWAAFHFFCTAANAERVRVGPPGGKSTSPVPPWQSVDGWPIDPGPDPWPESQLDRFVISALYQGALDVEEAGKRGRFAAAYVRLDQVLNELGWYLAAARERFWKRKGDPDKEAAFRTLHRALVYLARILAPFAPFLAEVIYLSLSEGRSVHLERWPGPAHIPFDEAAYHRIRAEMAVRGG